MRLGGKIAAPVTGAAGGIGQRLLPCSLKKGATVYATDIAPGAFGKALFSPSTTDNRRALARHRRTSGP